MTRQLVWEKYKAEQPEGYQYSRFSELYRQWRSKLDLSKAGEKLLVDYCGQTVATVPLRAGSEPDLQLAPCSCGFLIRCSSWSSPSPLGGSPAP